MSLNQLRFVITLVLLGIVASAQSEGANGTFTEAQATKGKKSYNQYCADCHHMTLKGSGHGPELTGPNFIGA